jgi:Uma2 family endonuclease
MHVPNPWRNQIPPLENGDRLSRAEFERRYHAMPHVKKAELIEGVVHMPSPTRLAAHGTPHGHALTWIGTYAAFTPGTAFADNATVLLDLDNEPQPDAVLFILPSHGGNVMVTADDYIERAPELVVEVTSSSASIDLGPKHTVYRRNGVREYLVWRVLDGAIDWFVLRGTEFDRLAADPAGVIRSEAFPGLWLNTEALADGRLADVLTTLQQGLASAEHQTFVAELTSRGA